MNNETTPRPSADDTHGGPDDAGLPGDEARKPTDIPARGWWQVTRRAFTESGADNVPMLAGGVAPAT